MERDFHGTGMSLYLVYVSKTKGLYFPDRLKCSIVFLNPSEVYKGETHSRKPSSDLGAGENDRGLLNFDLS